MFDPFYSRSPELLFCHRADQDAIGFRWLASLIYFVSARGVGGGVWLMVHTRIFQVSPSRTKIADQ